MNQAHFERGLRILGLLEQIGGVAIGLITLSIAIPGLININPAMTQQSIKGATAILALGLSSGVFLFFVGSMLKKFNKMAWMATIAMCAMSAALNLTYFNFFGLIIPAVYLFYLLHPHSREIIRIRAQADSSPRA